MKSVRFESIHDDHKTVERFISFIIDQLENNVDDEVNHIIDQGYLGFNAKTGRVGMLISEEIAAFRAFTQDGEDQS